ncbi:unannotated protein [freshwater metagenome]|uniref:Unannotated protein n=1 Tax=freshwater metagenome TaxID=449393 RepID=A0A6J7FZS0_9ZZZZ
MRAIVVDVDDLGELVVVDDRERQHQLAAALGTGGEQVVLRPDRGANRGDHFFADGIERRVRDLREQLLEVIEQQPGTIAEHGQRRVGAHRPDRLGAGPGHRRNDDLELFVGVPEDLLAAQHTGMAELDVLVLGEIAQLDEPLIEPILIGMFAGECALDLVIGHDASLSGVYQEHAPGLQPALLHDARRIDVDHAALTGEYDEVVVGDPVAARSQPIAVEDSTDHGAVGEGNAGRAVPRLHQRGVEAVEGPLGGVHDVVVLPGLRDHHQHRVRQRTATKVEQFEHFVEARRVRAAGRADGKGPLDTGQQGAAHQGLAGAHPVAVALHGVDLAVVGDVAVRVRQRPRREGVGAEAAVHQRQGALDALVPQIGEEHRQLRRGEHALVDQGPAGQRREVGALLARQLVFDALARHEHLAIEIDPCSRCGVGDEQLLEARHHRTSARPEAGRIDGNGTPSESAQALFGDDGLDRGHGLGSVTDVSRQERQADGVLTHGRKFEAGDRTQEAVRHLDEDAGTIAGIGLGPGGATVLHVAQGADAHGDNGATGDTVDVGDEGDTTGIVFESRVVEPNGRGVIGMHRPHPLKSVWLGWTLGTTLARTVTSMLRERASFHQSILDGSAFCVVSRGFRPLITRRGSSGCGSRSWPSRPRSDWATR